jgi:predicted porin
MMGEQSNKSEESGLGLSYNFGFMTAMGGTAVTKTQAGAKTRDMTYLGATVPLRPGLTGLAGWSKDSSKASNADTKWGVGVNYALSKRTTVGADVFEQEAANRSTGFVLRARHTF